jgi:hypothetical protein
MTPNWYKWPVGQQGWGVVQRNVAFHLCDDNFFGKKMHALDYFVGTLNEVKDPFAFVLGLEQMDFVLAAIIDGDLVQIKREPFGQKHFRYIQEYLTKKGTL